jgi:hypothetical protein
MNKTPTQFDTSIKTCREVFIKKHKDYGTSWRIMRVSSILDQIFIKATRIRTIEENGMMKVNEGIEPEYMGIINYCVMGLIQIELKNETEIELSEERVSTLYDKYIKACKDLMMEKNHDYGEVWRNMQISTFTDMLLMRIHRMRQILENDGKTIMSEGIDSNLMDMVNYSVFALIRLNEQKI